MQSSSGSGNAFKPFSFLDLFSGIGAMRLGLEQACADAGLTARCACFSEIDKAAIGVYRSHFPGTHALGDVNALVSSSSALAFDILLAGFPCPAFSSAGRKKGFSDERGRLFFALAKVIGRERPRAFLLENVKGLVSHNGGRTLATILDVLRYQLGYRVYHAVLNSRDFGVPQNRPRIFFVGFRELGEGFRFPEPTDSTKLLKDILETEPVHPRHYLTEQYLSGIRRHKARHAAKGNGFGFRIIDPARDVAAAIVCGGMGKERNLIIDRRIAEFPTLSARKSPISKECIRRLTPNEWEALQGLPSDWTVGQADGPRYTQLGNAVTVPVIRAISRNLLAAMAPPEPIPRPFFISSNSIAAASSLSLPLTAVDLCGGCGGLSQGLVATGAIKVKVANELNPAAAQTYRLNHPGTVMIEQDLTTEEAKGDIVAALGGRRCDLLVGGIPCQAYSLSGRRDPTDPRGSLFGHFVELMRRLVPRVAVIENVPGILSMKRPDGTPVMHAIARAFRELGYAIGHLSVNSADYGDPQSRKRVVILGWREGRFPSFEKTHDERGRSGLPGWRTVRDAIGDLDDAPEDIHFRHVFVKSGPEYIERIKRTPVGQSVALGYGESFFRNPPDEPAITVKANNGGVLVHYAKDRLMTPRELARLQGFPDHYRFSGTKGEMLRQVGNAVPVGLATAIGKAVRKMLGTVVPPPETTSPSIPVLTVPQTPKPVSANVCPLGVKGDAHDTERHD